MAKFERESQRNERIPREKETKSTAEFFKKRNYLAITTSKKIECGDNIPSF